MSYKPEIYAPGAPGYNSLLRDFGKPAADYVWQVASASDADKFSVNDAYNRAKYGGALPTSTIGEFYNLVTTNPLAAPLEGANNLVGNTILSFLKNPLITGLLIGAALLWLMGPKKVLAVFGIK